MNYNTCRKLLNKTIKEMCPNVEFIPKNSSCDYGTYIKVAPDRFIGILLFQYSRAAYRLSTFGCNAHEVALKHGALCEETSFDLSFHPDELKAVVSWLVPALKTKIIGLPDFFDLPYPYQWHKGFLQGYFWTHKGLEAQNRLCGTRKL